MSADVSEEGAAASGKSTKYDLVANICHDSFTDAGTGKTVANAAGENPLTSGSYRVHVKNDCTGQVMPRLCECIPEGFHYVTLFSSYAAVV